MYLHHVCVHAAHGKAQWHALHHVERGEEQQVAQLVNRVEVLW